MNFAQLLNKIMEEKDITAYRVAKRLGVHQTTIANWRSGKSTPKTELLPKIAEALETPVYTFLPQNLAEKYLEYEDIAYDVKETFIREAETQEEIEAAKTLSIPHVQMGLLLSELERMRIQTLSALFLQLNSHGQEKAIEELKKLVDTAEYQK